MLIENDATLQAGGILTIAARMVTLGPWWHDRYQWEHSDTGCWQHRNRNRVDESRRRQNFAILGGKTYDILTTEAGRTDLGSALGTGTCTINANATTNLELARHLPP